MLTNKTDQLITLNDGRKLGFADYGEPNGKVVFHFHGSAGSRVDHPDESILKDLNVRYIAVDRPGYGLSEYQANRKLLDWPDDIGQLADHLGIEKFYILGVSAGGPYALSCAYKIPERIIAGAIVSGFAPPDKPHPKEGYSVFPRIFLFAAHYVRPLVYLFRKLGYSQIKSGKKISIDGLPIADRKVLEKPENFSWFKNTIKEAYSQGWRGVALDDILILNPWGFDISKIKVHFAVWQGEVDENVPLCHGEYQHNMLSESDLHVLMGEGHLYILIHWREILEKLIS